MFRQNNEQYEVRFRLDDDVQWRGDEARVLLSNLFTGWVGPHIQKLFHHQDNGQNGIGIPTLRFRGGRGFFGLIAIGEEAVETLRELEIPIRRRLADHVGRPIRAEAISSDIAIRPGERMSFYRAHNAVIARKHKQIPAFFDASPKDIEEIVRATIIRDIRRQALSLDLELPADSFPLAIQEMGRRGRIPLKRPGQRLYAGCLGYIDFATSLQLTGHWTIGGLQNRGYGSIRPHRSSQRVTTDCPRPQMEIRYAQL